MQPEQPNTPSTDVQSSDAAAVETNSDEQREGSSPHWWQRLFNRDPGPETSDASGDSKDTSSASKPLNLTTEELERRIQAETDRREAKRAADAKKTDRKTLESRGCKRSRGEAPSQSRLSQASAERRTLDGCGARPSPRRRLRAGRQDCLGSPAEFLPRGLTNR
jgi:hypothetical protein